MELKMNTESALSLITPELIINTMAEGVMVLDANAIIRKWNKAMTEITGYNEAEMLGELVFELRAPGCTNSSNIGKLMEDSPANPDSIIGCECRMLAKSGERIPVLVNARTLRDNDGRIIGILQTITDFRPVEKLRCELRELQTRVEPYESIAGMAGHSKAMRELSRLIRLAAGSDASVLILGESGTGKELAAGAVHQLSKRKNKALIKVNCGALPETLLESELFGHVKGAFTGAIRDRQGRFEAADGGSIFLDEIGEVSPAVQVKLLRVLQEGEFEKVGSSTTRRVNVRIIAATNLDLAEEVRKGNFREDLYYRLRVFPLQVPPLRNRVEDIPVLIAHFIKKYSQKTGRHISAMSPQAMTRCVEYHWPGNVRELENAIEYAFVVCPGGKSIGIEHLPGEVHSRPGSFHYSASVQPADKAASRKILSERIALIESLEAAEWNKARVARKLNVSRTLVWKWMKKHHIPLRMPKRDT
eukprot:TRINITY_DN8403_c0_g1_i4.p1 TRINITY_DN8403_c0_g1~~TRINITY_DN8403_c0_g1_i4.p1  ORF type:complete len:475 (+),score=108.13 TRINITY_DN8403_c0_g1_i4:1834-3258(+)